MDEWRGAGKFEDICPILAATGNNWEMTATNDMELVREFAGQNSERAFAELVRRHINLVHSVALRFTGNAGDAQDVTQAVFIILARKAAGLSARTVLTGWLYETTRFTAMRVLRTQTRRRAHEQEASMQFTVEERGDDNLWRQLAPLLEAAMSQLGQRDRTLLALRYYENKTGSETASLLGIPQETARKRTHRALEKLRRYFSRHGVNSTTALIAGSISAYSVQVVPVALAKSAAALAVAKGAAAGGSTIALVNGVMKLMAWTKAKTAMLATLGVVLCAGTAALTVRKIENINANNPDRWRNAGINLQTLEQLPPQVRILPSTFPGPGRRAVRASGSGGDRKMAGFGFQVSAIFAAAYGKNDARIIFTAAEPANRYDFICNLPSHQAAALQNALKKLLGLEGKVEVRETDVLLLTVKNPNAPGLRPSAIPPNSKPSLQGTLGHLSGANTSLPNLANDIEQRLNIPVIDQTGLANGRFDFDLTWDASSPRLNVDGLKQAVVNQLGLELVPTNIPIEMVVVHKTKN